LAAYYGLEPSGVDFEKNPDRNETMRKNLVILFAIVVLLLTADASAQCTLKNRDITVRMKLTADTPAIDLVAAADGHFRINKSPEELPAHVESGEQSLPLHWKFASEKSKCDEHKVEMLYETTTPHLRAHWIWETRSQHGPMEHRIVIENLSGRELWLPQIESLALSFVAEKGTHHFSVEKGADTPSAEGVHDSVVDDQFNWIGRTSNYARPMPGEDREIIPIEIVYDEKGAQAGWYAGLVYSGRSRILYQRSNMEHGALDATWLGLNPDPGPYKTRLTVDGSFETPTAFLGVFSGGPDGAGNQLRPWVREVLGNPKTWSDPQYPLMVNNSWGSGMAVDEDLALRMIGDSKELGLEMFHMDAGWFRGVGDWYPDPQKFPHGLASIADAAHKAGLRFGLWTDWTQAGTDTNEGALSVFKVQNWVARDVAEDWKTNEYKGDTIDIGVPAAKDYAAGELKRIVEDYHLDMLEHDGYLVLEGCSRTDHPHAPPDKGRIRLDVDAGFEFVIASNSTDVSYHATRAYYAIYEQLRREHPGLLFEVCNDGGRMVDFGTAAHADYFSITDTYDPISNRRAFYDTSYVLPAAMLESYVEKWDTPHIENFMYMLRSGMMGWTSIMLDTTVWTKEQHEAARESFALYKSELRPLIRDAQLYHVSERPNGERWDGMEYFDPVRSKGVLFAFHGSVSDEPTHHFVLHGLRADGIYKLRFVDHSSPDSVAKGSELMGAGLVVNLPKPLSSELVFLDEVRQ
jgi:hypothetical protein